MQTDSIHTADTTHLAGAHSWAPAPFASSPEALAPYSRADKILYHTSAPGWLSGVNATPRHLNAADNPGVLALMVGVFVLLGFNMGSVRRLFKALPQKLWSVRRRGNAFDETTTNETRSLILLLTLLVFSQGLLLYKWLGDPARGAVFTTVAALCALAAAFYIFKLLACISVGYVFSDKNSAASWRRGENASEALLGTALTIPAVLALFYPSISAAMLGAAATLYILSRIMFIIKGFRIFYKNFLSLLYFILYLCALEIIPVIVLYISASDICSTI